MDNSEKQAVLGQDTERRYTKEEKKHSTEN